MTKFNNLKDLESLAKGNMSQMAYDYFAGAACDGISHDRNQRAFNEITLHYHVLRNVSTGNIDVTWYGEHYSSPIAIAPMSLQQLAHPNGETETATASAKTNSLMCVSALSTVNLETVTKSNSNTWMQLYPFKTRDITSFLIEKAEKCGCKALVITVDTPVLGVREKDIHQDFYLPNKLKLANLSEIGFDALPISHDDESSLAAYADLLFSSNLGWDEIAWIKQQTNLPVLAKGIIRADDALLALKYGLDGIIVSNHGGRQLDTCPTTIEVLPSIVKVID